MLEAVKKAALVYLDAPPDRLWRPRARRDYWSSHHTVLAPTNKYLAKSNKSDTGGKATKKHEARSCPGR
jgi:hypothetical protein